MNDAQPSEVREALAQQAPQLWREIEQLSSDWIAPAIKTLGSSETRSKRRKTFNDPVWGGIELYPWEVVLVDTPLLQRLRGIRQLGMAHHVYPGATHNRFEHSIGVVEAADRIMRMLQRQDDFRKSYRPTAEDPAIPTLEEEDRIAVRLAALLHDIGHGPFSHASEPVLRRRLAADFDAADRVLQFYFKHAGAISTSEMIAVLFILSEPMRRVFVHEKFGAPVHTRDLSMMVAARVVGSPLYIDAAYLAGVINGALDADKLDYMARDSHYSGLPLGLDLDRIISKIEVIGRDPAAPSATSEPTRVYRMGMAHAGLGAYEQMIIARVFLYDRLYFHHKVRAADAMAYHLIQVAEEERNEQYSLSELLAPPSDEAFISVLGGELTSSRTPSGGGRAAELASMVRCHDFYHRAFVFAERFLAGIPASLGTEAAETRGRIWTMVRNAFSTLRGVESISKRIHERARDLQALETFKSLPPLRREHVIVDLAPSLKVTPIDSSNRVTNADPDILTRAADGSPLRPNLFFDPAKWSQAYETQKHAGYVFCPSPFVQLVATAARIVFFEAFNVAVTPDASKAAKTYTVDFAALVREAAKLGLCSAECVAALTEDVVLLQRISEDAIRLPQEWLNENPTLREELARALGLALDRGLPATMHESVVSMIEHLATFVTMVERVGKFAHKDSISEQELQDALRTHLESRGVAVTEANKVGGGETDLVVGNIVIENKKRGATADPFSTGREYDWQVRRYAIPVFSNVAVVVVAYKPASAKTLLPISHRLRVHPVKHTPERRAHIRVVVPYGHGKPSDEKAP